MILTYGTEEDLASLASSDWYMVELRSEKTIESTLKRIGIQIPAIFAGSAVELFIPVLRRDINTLELKTSNYLFARSRNFHALLRLRTITGVVGLVTLGDVNHPSKAIVVQNEYVQRVIEECREMFEARARFITLGSFVRLIDGDERNFCGVVVDLSQDYACVAIDIKTKIVLVETPVKNLLDLSHVPKHLRVFYYAPAVESLVRLEQDELVTEDLHYLEDHVVHEDHYDVEQTGKRGRQQTVTALVKRLILTGTLAPMTLAEEVVSALKDGRLKCPKTLAIIHGIIKHRLIVDYFVKRDPGIVNYREVVTRFGAAWRFPFQDFVIVGRDLPIPVSTPDHPHRALDEEPSIHSFEQHEEREDENQPGSVLDHDGLDSCARVARDHALHLVDHTGGA